MSGNFVRGQDFDGTFILMIDFMVGPITAIWSITNITNGIWIAGSIIFLTLVISAYVLMIWAIIYQAKKISFHEYEDHVVGLIKNGPYRFVRHPWYFADFVLIIASFLVVIPTIVFKPNPLVGMEFFGVCSSFVFSFFGLIGILSRSSREENFLEGTFGNEFKEYKINTPFLIPYI